jgi:hypothetical protein
VAKHGKDKGRICSVEECNPVAVFFVKGIIRISREKGLDDCLCSAWNGTKSLTKCEVKNLHPLLAVAVIVEHSKQYRQEISCMEQPIPVDAYSTKKTWQGGRITQDNGLEGCWCFAWSKLAGIFVQSVSVIVVKYAP